MCSLKFGEHKASPVSVGNEVYFPGDAIMGEGVWIVRERCWYIMRHPEY